MAKQDSTDKNRRVMSWNPDPFQSGSKESYSYYDSENLAMPGVQEFIDTYLYNPQITSRGLYKNIMPAFEWRAIYDEKQFPGLYSNQIQPDQYISVDMQSDRMGAVRKYLEDKFNPPLITRTPMSYEGLNRPVPYDALVAGYLPLIQQEQPAPSQRPIRYERASGHIKELKRPARSQY